MSQATNILAWLNVLQVTNVILLTISYLVKNSKCVLDFLAYNVCKIFLVLYIYFCRKLFIILLASSEAKSNHIHMYIHRYVMAEHQINMNQKFTYDAHTCTVRTWILYYNYLGFENKQMDGCVYMRACVHECLCVRTCAVNGSFIAL